MECSQLRDVLLKYEAKSLAAFEFKDCIAKVGPQLIIGHSAEEVVDLGHSNSPLLALRPGSGPEAGVTSTRDLVSSTYRWRLPKELTSTPTARANRGEWVVAVRKPSAILAPNRTHDNPPIGASRVDDDRLSGCTCGCLSVCEMDTFV